MRELPAWEVMRPNVPASRLVAGLPQLKWFNRLNVSTRNSRVCPAPTGRAAQGPDPRSSIPDLRCSWRARCPRCRRRKREGGGVEIVGERSIAVRVLVDLIDPLSGDAGPRELLRGGDGQPVSRARRHDAGRAPVGGQDAQHGVVELRRHIPHRQAWRSGGGSEGNSRDRRTGRSDPCIRR